MHQDERQTKSQMILSILIGVILIAAAASFYLSHHRARGSSDETLSEILYSYRTVDRADQIAPRGEPPDYVYIQGQVSSDDELIDEDFGIRLTGLYLERRVQELVREMVRRPEGRPLVELHWRERTSLPMTSYRRQPEPVTLLGHRVSGRLIDYLEGGSAIACDDTRITRTPSYDGRELICRPDGTFYSKPEGAAEDVGDIRVTFSYMPLGVVSMIARREGSDLTLIADKDGTYLNLISAGEYRPEELVAKAQGENADRSSSVAWFSLAVSCLGLFLVIAPFWKRYGRRSR